MNKLLDPNKIWEVTTEGDCEGKSIKSFGYFQGTVLDIATKLRGNEAYQLSFREFALAKYPVLSDRQVDKDSVSFSVSGYSKEQLEKELKGKVEHSSLYGAVTLKLSKDAIKEAKIQAAKAKLSDEEKQLLGIID